MLKFMLVATLFVHGKDPQSYVMDSRMSAGDCIESLEDLIHVVKANVSLSCETQLPGE